MNRKCEFILVWDTVMTDSAKYADILLPDAMRSEQLNMQTQGYSEWYTGVSSWVLPLKRPLASAAAATTCALISPISLGVKEAFTEGRTHDEWANSSSTRRALPNDPAMPTWEEIKEQGIYKRELEASIALKDFRRRPCCQPPGNPFGQNRALL